MDEQALLLAHMDDISKKATKTGFAASRFLTPAQAVLVEQRFKKNHTFTFDGGFNGAERTRAIFTNPDWGSYERDELFAALRFSYRAQDKLTHRDILGALMALGIKRDTLGDIICDDDSATLVCLPELGSYISESLTKAGRAGISASVISLDELPSREESLAIKTYNVASLRLDVVICAAFNLSRTKASALIAANRVSVNHQPCLHSSKELAEDTLISVRGMGRAKLIEVGGTSKKGRLFIQIGLYV